MFTTQQTILEIDDLYYLLLLKRLRLNDLVNKTHKLRCIPLSNEVSYLISCE